MFTATIVGKVTNDKIDIITEKGRKGESYRYTTVTIDTGRYYGKTSLVPVRCYGALADNCKKFLKQNSIACFFTEATSYRSDPTKIMFTAINGRFFTEEIIQDEQED